ncbi:MAG: tetratricopeptide repeat protein, partial [Bacteroidetes bacterium]|nr:tetratricopeptide repeat protein [Bacteroidota bacterium]
MTVLSPRPLLCLLVLNIALRLVYCQSDSSIFDSTDSLFRSNQGGKAIHHIEHFLSQWEEEEKWDFYIRGLNRLVRYRELDENIELRRQLNQKAIISSQRFLSDSHKLLGEAYQQEGEIYLALGQMDSALISLDQSNRIFRQSKEWESLCWVLILKGAISHYQQELSLGEEAMLDALKVFEQHPDLDPEILNTILQNLSIIYIQTGAFDKSMRLAQEAVKVTLKKPALNYSDSLRLAERYNNLGLIYSERRDLEEAIKNYKISLNLRLRLNQDDFHIIRLYNNIGSELQFLGKNSQAQTYFFKSYEKVKHINGPDTYKEVIRTLTFLGSSYRNLGDIDKSLSFLLEAQKLAIHHQYYTSWTNYNLGRTYKEKKDWLKTIFHLKKSEQLFQQELGENHSTLVTSRRRIAEAYADMDSLDQSLTYVEKALKSLYPNFNPVTHFDNPELKSFSAYTLLLPILEVKGSVLKKMYRENTESLKKVLHTYDLATKTIDYIRETQTSEASKLVLSTNARQTYEGAIEILGQLFQQSGEKTYLEQVFTYMEKSRSLVLLENVRKYKEIQLNLEPQLTGDSVFQGLLAREKFLKREQVFYEKKLAEAQLDNDSAKIATLEKSLAGFYLEQQNLQTQFKDKYPT